MKLKNLLFATMVAAAFTACSNDETPTPQTGEEGQTTLTIKTKGVQTKAADDSAINNLLVLVADASGVIELVLPNSTDDKTVTGEVVTTAGMKQILAFANVAESEFLTGTETTLKGKNISTLLTAKRTFDKEASYLSMNSGVYSANIALGKHNFIGFTQTEANAACAANGHTEGLTNLAIANPLKLYRNVAKVEVASVQLKPTAANAVAFYAQYPNATFEPTEIRITQSPVETMLEGASHNHWGTTFSAEKWYSIGNSDKFFNWNKDNASTTVTRTTDMTTAVTLGTENKITHDRLYVYENTNTKTDKSEPLTLITITGTFSYGLDEAPLTTTTRHYTFALGIDGTVNFDLTQNFEGLNETHGRGTLSATKPGVLRNLKYVVDATLTGIGKGGENEDGDDTYLDVKVKVVEWGTVTQAVEID